MRYVRWAAVVFLLLLSQATWVPRVRIAGVGPDLLFGVVFVFALRRGATWGAWVGFVLGLLIGIEEPDRLGRDSLALAMAGLLVGRASHGLDRGNPLVQVGLLVTGSFLADLVRALDLTAGDPGALPGLVLRRVVPGAVYTTLVWPPLSWAARRLLGRRGWLPGAP